MKTIVFVALCLLSGVLFAREFDTALSRAAIARTHHAITYDGSYRSIAYPGGDVPSDIGVCTDVIVRSYRALGVDLQRLVHEDMLEAFDAYPSRRIWGLSRPDPNIDHRRVPNLQAFFTRNGTVLPVSQDPGDYSAGEIVTWDLGGNVLHIGVVTHKPSDGTGHPMVVHNIGAGPGLEDVLFDYEITGHYRYQPEAWRAGEPYR